METAKTASTTVQIHHVWLLLLLGRLTAASIECRWLHTGEHVVLLRGPSEGGLLWLLLLLGSLAAESGLPLLLRRLLSRGIELAKLTVVLLLLLECAIEELWLEATTASCRLLARRAEGVARRLLRSLHLLLLLLHHHLLLLHLLLAAALTDAIPVTHDFEGGILGVRWVSLWVLGHHVKNVIDHVLLILLLVLLLGLRRSRRLAKESPKSVILSRCSLRGSRDEVAKLVVIGLGRLRCRHTYQIWHILWDSYRFGSSLRLLCWRRLSSLRLLGLLRLWL